jgi:hypothetical protein
VRIGRDRRWQYTGPPISGWALLGNNPATDFITSSSGNALAAGP